MSELAIRVRRTPAGRPSDRLVWSVLADWRRTGQLPRGFTIHRSNYGRRVGPRAWLRYVAVVKDTWRPGVVLCDFDSRRRPAQRLIWFRLHKARLLRSLVAYRWDRTRRGWHLIIVLRQQLTLTQTIALQAILGSDPHREAFNLARAIGLDRRPSAFWAARANILYERKLEWQEQQKGHAAQRRRVASVKADRPKG